MNNENEEQYVDLSAEEQKNLFEEGKQNAENAVYIFRFVVTLFIISGFLAVFATLWKH